MTTLKEDFNKLIFGSFLGDALRTEMKKSISKELLNENGLVMTRNLYQLSQKEALRSNSERYSRAFKIVKSFGNNDFLRNLNAITPVHGFFLNTNAFLVTIELLGNEQQANHWRNEVFSGRVIGGYGQTEIGHGSNVKGLETTATYNEQKRKWILNSPTVTSTKFWPGLLGHCSTHQVVQAKTFVKGKNIGIQTFVIEIRTQKLKDVKNVEAFDIGPKLGFEAVDNGGLILHNFEVPKESMLMKYVKVTDEGQIEGLQNTSAIKYSYGSMLNLRVQLVFGFYLQSIVLQLASLYEILKSRGEHLRQDNRKFIIDRLCVGYGGCLVNVPVLEMYQNFVKQVGDKNFKQADSLLAKVHIISSTFKALSSRMSIDTAIQLATFKNFSKFKTSKFPDNLSQSTPSTTYEGDNSVLLQQTSKFLLFKINTEKQISIKKIFKSGNWEDASNALQFVVMEELKEIKRRIEDFQEKGEPFKKIMNQLEQTSLIRLSKIWGFMTMVKMLRIVLTKMTNHQQFYSKICSGFCSYLLSQIPELQVYGFVVQFEETWKSFSEQQYSALAQFKNPFGVDFEPFKYIPRSHAQILAKL